MQLKHNLKKYRKDVGLTLQEVADYLGVQKPTVQRYESGIVKNIPNEKVEKLAKLFNITTDELFGVDGEKPTPDDLDEWDAKHNANGKLAKEVKVCELIEECHGSDAVEVIFLYAQLDANDRAEIRGEMKHMLKADKYAIKKESKNA